MGYKDSVVVSGLLSLKPFISSLVRLSVYLIQMRMPVIAAIKKLR